MGFVHLLLWPICEWLDRRITAFSHLLLDNAMTLVMAVALTLVTLWILIQGYRIVTGVSREPMVVMVANMTKIALIVSIATAMTVGGKEIQELITVDLARGINELMTGKDESPAKAIDKNLAYTQLAMGAIEAVQVPVGDIANSSAKDRASLMAMLGVAGPPMTAGAMLLLYKMALALQIGLGPLFIMCLIFPQTKQFFHKWLMFVLATLFSMAMLNVVMSMVLDLTERVASALWLSDAFASLLKVESQGLTNQAMQQGGVGLLMTVLIVSTPPMAAAFFNGMMGGFQPFAQVNGGGSVNQPGPQGQPPGSWGGGPSKTSGPNDSSNTSDRGSDVFRPPPVTLRTPGTSIPDEIKPTPGTGDSR